MPPQTLSMPNQPGARRPRLGPARWILAGLAISTIAATALVTLSVLALDPPRVDLPSWLAAAALFTGQGVVALVVIAGFGHGRILRLLLGVGGAMVAWLGGSWAYATVSSAHFEGHALVLGTALALQGVLSIWIATAE